MLSFTQYNVLAGLTVYAVPQVLAATSPMRRAQRPSGQGGQAGARAHAGPVVLVLSLLTRRLRDEADEAAPT